MNYLSLCSGIEAATVAWHPLKWQAVAFSEVDKFCCALLKHYYPDAPNAGDMTKVEWHDYRGTVDLIVGGTPCQSFSVAGKRLGLDDPRGNLTLHYIRILDAVRPRWFVWENVPGVLSDDDGRTFGQIIGEMARIGYGVCWRVLDAQYFGVPQRRRRVFVVGHLGDWRRAAQVLLERESLHGDTPPKRKTRADLAGTLKGGTGERGYPDPGDGNGGGLVSCIKGAAIGRKPEAGPQYGEILEDGSCYTLNCTERHAVIAHALTADGFDASEDGTGRGIPLCAFNHQTGGDVRLGYGDQATALQANQGVALHQGMTVRRLTPRECERLQGFPDDYTLIPYNGKPAADGPRYRALGNSMAVPVMRWIGRRMAQEVLEW